MRGKCRGVSKAGFPNLSAADIWGWIIPCCGSGAGGGGCVLRVVGCVSASLGSTF